MHGAGNDFVMLNALAHEMPQDLAAFSRDLSHRHFGIGADQVLIAYPSKQADFRMDIYNADGGRVEMCGNGIRCFIHYLRDQGLTDKTDLTIETLGGLIKPQLIVDHPKKNTNTEWVRVDMGEPILEGSEVPTTRSGKLINIEYELQNTQNLLASDPKVFNLTAVSMGNPHCVIFVDDVENYPVERIGSAIENDPLFPNRVNVEFVQVKDRTHLIQRTWERGSGETYACGTGASAVAVAAILTDQVDRQLTISLKGGDLDLFWDEETGHVFKTGPSVKVFEGEWL
jgi:diaminopimelate epimerase